MHGQAPYLVVPVVQDLGQVEYVLTDKTGDFYPSWWLLIYSGTTTAVYVWTWHK